MKIAVIDISSSSISLLVAQVGEKEEILFRDRSSLTLLHYLEGRSLSARGIDKLAEAVAAMMEKCRSVRAETLYVISTAALRAVENFEQVREEILRRTGVPVNFVDGETEAYCDFVANRGYGKGAVLIDIGGASTEVCDLSKDSASHRRSLRFGVLDLHRKFVSRIQPDEKEGEKIRKYVRKKFRKEKIAGRAFGTAVLAGATNLALYAVYAEYARIKDREGARVMQPKKFKKLTEHLLGGAGRSRLILDAAPEKLYSVGIAAVVVREFVKCVGAETIVVSERGVKEGYLRLVCDGALHGAAYTFAAELPVPAEETETAAAEAPAEKKPASARRGRPPKAKHAEGEAKTPARRGRPPKAKPAPAAEDAPAEGKEQQPAEKKPASARRGRPPKAKPAPAAEDAPAEGKEQQPAEKKPASARRGRPPKAKPAPAAKEGAPAEEKEQQPAEQSAESVPVGEDKERSE